MTDAERRSLQRSARRSHERIEAYALVKMNHLNFMRVRDELVRGLRIDRLNGWLERQLRRF